jgi:hypothetical protein
MIAFRRISLYAALPLVVLLLGCPGKTAPAARHDVDVSQYLPQRDTSWTNQPPARAQVALGSDSVTVEWIPTHQGPHRSISSISVLVPEHPESDTYTAHILPGTHVNMGAREARVEGITVRILRTPRRGEPEIVTIHVKGDGTSAIV